MSILVYCLIPTFYQQLLTTSKSVKSEKKVLYLQLLLHECIFGYHLLYEGKKVIMTILNSEMNHFKTFSGHILINSHNMKHQTTKTVYYHSQSRGQVFLGYEHKDID